MTPRVGPVLLLVLALGCARALPSAQAPAVFVTHVDAAGRLEPTNFARGSGFTGTADLGFESAGCCGGGLYVAGTSRGGYRAEKRERASDLLEGGLELEIVVPAVEDRLRLRARAGKAGTIPKPPYLGRSGFASSMVLLARIWDPKTPPVNEFGADIDLFVGYSAIALERERSAAGAMGDPISSGGLLLGLRIGAEYGIDLQ